MFPPDHSAHLKNVDSLKSLIIWTSIIWIIFIQYEPCNFLLLAVHYSSSHEGAQNSSYIQWVPISLWLQVMYQNSQILKSPEEKSNSKADIPLFFSFYTCSLSPLGCHLLLPQSHWIICWVCLVPYSMYLVQVQLKYSCLKFLNGELCTAQGITAQKLKSFRTTIHSVSIRSTFP